MIRGAVLHLLNEQPLLIDVFDLSDLQAEYILELRLRRLTKFSRIELEAEADKLRAEIEFLEGVLAGLGEGPVNYVNAASLAEARGLTATETTQSVLPDFPRLITVSAIGPRGPVTVSGTSLGPEHKSRLVHVFGEDIDIDPAPHMLFLRYVDAPGVGGAVGTMLGEWGVNIGHMSVGRGTSEREAVMALTLDEPLDETQLDQLVERCGLSFGAGVEL